VPPGWRRIGGVAAGERVTVGGAADDGAGWDHFR
jgi:hypothetical protein